MANVGAASVLRAHPIFRGLSADTLAKIVALCENRHFQRGETVFTEGQSGTRLYGVIAGRLTIFTSSSDGQELSLNTAEPGEIVGEIAFLDGGPRTASARAAERTTCFWIDRVPFYELLETTPSLTVHLLQLVCTRVRWMTHLVTDSTFLSIPERLALRLSYLARPSLRTAGLEVRISQAELAQFLGISRQVVNSYLRMWEREGRVELRRGAIWIADMKGLLHGSRAVTTRAQPAGAVPQ